LPVSSDCCARARRHASAASARASASWRSIFHVAVLLARLRELVLGEPACLFDQLDLAANERAAELELTRELREHARLGLAVELQHQWMLAWVAAARRRVTSIARSALNPHL
jgi:hypothetical protein